MIKVDEFSVEVEGTRGEIASEIAFLIRYLGYDKKIFTKEKFQDLVDDAFKSSEEVDAELKKILEEKMNSVEGLLELLEATTKLKKELKKSSKPDSDDEEDNIFRDLFGDKNE